MRGRPLRRRRGDGRRPPGHLRQPDQPPHDREGVPGRPLLRRRHRRRRRSGHGDGQALPAPARALREGRGRRPQPRGQGQPARPDGAQPTCPPPCRAWPWCRCSPATTCAAAAGRLFQYDVTGGRYEETDFAATGSGSLHAGTVVKLGFREGLDRDERRRPRRSRRCSRRPTRTPPPAAPTWSAASSRSSPPSPPRASSGSTDAEIAERFGALLDVLDRPRRRHRRCPRPHRHGGRPVMSMPFYVAPEQVMKDRADYARKGIARGRSLVGRRLRRRHPASAPRTRRRTLRKVSEIYDRIAFAGVGKYNEFDQLRIAGVRHADLKGYSYSREDVDARSLANQYAQILGQVFTHEMKPMEVEILVAEVGADAGRRPAVPHPLRRHRDGRGPLHRARRRGRGDRATGMDEPLRAGPRPGRRPSSAAVAGAGRPRPRRSRADELEVARARPHRRPPCLPSARATTRSPSPPRCRARAPPGRCGEPRSATPSPSRAVRADGDACHVRRGGRTGSVRAMERRIFGLENEYGVTCTLRGQRRLSPDEVARYLFRRVVSWGRSTNVFLANGARLYLDVGSHPEYATPECDSIHDLVVHDKAGERILEQLLGQRRAAPRARRASAASSTCSRTTPTRPATPTAATRTTSPAGATTSATTPRC